MTMDLQTYIQKFVPLNDDLNSDNVAGKALDIIKAYQELQKLSGIPDAIVLSGLDENFLNKGLFEIGQNNELISKVDKDDVIEFVKELKSQMNSLTGVWRCPVVEGIEPYLTSQSSQITTPYGKLGLLDNVVKEVKKITHKKIVFDDPQLAVYNNIKKKYSNIESEKNKIPTLKDKVLEANTNYSKSKKTLDELLDTTKTPDQKITDDDLGLYIQKEKETIVGGWNNSNVTHNKCSELELEKFLKNNVTKRTYLNIVRVPKARIDADRKEEIFANTSEELTNLKKEVVKNSNEADEIYQQNTSLIENMFKTVGNRLKEPDFLGCTGNIATRKNDETLKLATELPKAYESAIKTSNNFWTEYNAAIQ